VKAAVFQKANAPLTIEDVDILGPNPGDSMPFVRWL
jgi:Zn-dependent alcohol dehydrogenase